MVYRARSIAEQFWEKVDRRGDDECWPWTGSRTAAAYGLFGKRLTYEGPDTVA